MDERGRRMVRFSFGFAALAATLFAAAPLGASPNVESPAVSESATAPASAAAPAAAPAPAVDPAVADLALGLGYRYMHVRTTLDQAFNLHAPTIQLSYFHSANVGWRRYLGFLLTVDVLFPVRGEQDGQSIKFSDTYESRIGFDVVMGAGTQVPIPRDDMSVVIGLGVHFNFTSLTDIEYANWNNLTFGFSSVTTYRWKYSDVFDVGVNFSLGVDFIDPMHEIEPLTWGINTAIVAVSGLHF